MSTNIAIAIVAHSRRLEAASTLYDQVDADKIFIDDGFAGEWGNHKKALRWGLECGAKHLVVLQDDAVPVEGFLAALEVAVSQKPASVIGLYLGTARPYAAEIAAAAEEARQAKAQWITHDSLLWGVGTVIPVPLLSDLLSVCSRSPFLPYDQRIGRWAKLAEVDVRYTWPSLIDHNDGPTVIKGRANHLEQVRVAHEVGVPNESGVEVPIRLA